MYRNLLNQIANILFINVQIVEKKGLITGKLGIALFFYEYARYINNTMYSDFSDEYIEEVYYKLRKDHPIDFINGLTGIGWCINYLIEKNYLEVEKDENILEEMDTLIIKMNQDTFLEESELDVALFSKGIYILQRGKLDNIISTMHQCGELLSSNKNISLKYLNSIFYFMNRAAELGLSQYICNPLFDKLYIQINNQINQEDIDNVDLYMLHRNISNVQYFNQKEKFENLKSCYEDDILALGFINLIYPYKNETELRKLDESKVQMIIDETIQNISESKLTIYNGLAGLGLELLRILVMTGTLR